MTASLSLHSTARAAGRRGLKFGVGLLLVILAPSALADLGLSNVQLTVTVLANSCVVSQDSVNKTVDLGNWASKQFIGAQQSPYPTRFQITLEDCGAATTGVQVTFTGTQDANDSTLLALNSDSTAANVAVAILDKDRNRIAIGQPSEVYALTAGGGNQPLTFYGQYVRTGAAVTPGSANADATFTLSYQ
ncbi:MULTISPECIES: fimbrial protein [unclassified Brenneria]|uniref:fimbrial protein n=1 Tax=unclassified Brenneria TaxID=2634434 RepID=UPI0029C315C8|nr:MULTISPECIES: fimbrial protein [unclassified Brenneria]MDX5627704.1 fimbrial protein [Brenneria sp. L3-3Z]MDX5695205.1 fimbrial protein [Brenneria sp. L4-2C]